MNGIGIGFFLILVSCLLSRFLAMHFLSSVTLCRVLSQCCEAASSSACRSELLSSHYSDGSVFACCRNVSCSVHFECRPASSVRCCTDFPLGSESLLRSIIFDCLLCSIFTNVLWISVFLFIWMLSRRIFVCMLCSIFVLIIAV